jgi:gliding motility-associated-like protein
MKKIIFALSFLPLAAGAQCSLTVNLGNDTTFCQGQSLQLSPGSYDTYLWDNGSTNPTRFVTQPGTYSVTVGEMGANLIVNGDFEAGNTGFTTEYDLGTGGSFGQLSFEGTYAINTSPSNVHTNFSFCADHTPALGTQMMIANGGPEFNQSVWCQTVAVDPNTDYQFRTWVMNALNDPNVAQLQFSINGTNIGSVFSPPATACNWVQFFQVWNSGSEVSADICIVNQNTNTGGNDFALDDISFAPICYADDEINVSTYPQPVIAATPNDTICAGEVASITASSATPGVTYVWNPGNIATATIHVMPTTSTVYSVIGTSADGCPSNVVNRTVVVYAQPVANIFINGNDTVCAGLQSILDGSSTVPNSTFSWIPGNTTNPHLVTTATVPSSTYTLTVTTPNGCTSDSTVTITVIPPLEVDISGNTSFCDGSSVTLSASGNQAGMEFTWSNGSHDQQITVNQAGPVYLYGDYFFCDQAKDTIYLTLDPDPQVFVPEDMEVCPGETVFLQVSSDQQGSTFSWQPGNLSGASNTVTTAGTVTYTVVAQNGSCTSDPQQFTIAATAACYLTVPNVFTPNGDGDNDFFELVNYDGLKSLECVIVNRWGNTVATFNTPAFKWDGKNPDGSAMEDGVYFYNITAVSKADEQFDETGIVELVRK